MVPKVLTAKELHELPRLTIVFIECFDGEYQAPLPTIFAGMKCYDGSIVDAQTATGKRKRRTLSFSAA